MALFDQWPYVNIHDLNTDWLVKTVKAVKDLAEAIKEKTDDIDDNVARARESAANAKISEDNAKGSEDAAKDYYDLTSALVGKPLRAGTLADMTDTTTIYIYTGSEPGMVNGDWYYYDGNDWVDGGKYGGDGGINTNARNILMYILDRVAYTEPGMKVYVEALYEALAHEIVTPPTTYTITNALVHVVNSNASTGCDAGDSYTATLTAEAGYSITSVVITMGDTDITSTAYDVGSGAINIASVSGNIVITASAINDVLYDLPSPQTFDGSLAGNYSTDLELLNTDIDYTITCQLIRTTASPNNSYVLQCMQGSSPYWGVKLQIESNKYKVFSYGVEDMASFTSFSPGTAGILKIVIRHTAGVNNAKWQMAGSSNTIITQVIGSTGDTTTSKLRIGGNNFVGVINKFKVYNRVLSDAEAVTFLEDNS